MLIGFLLATKTIILTNFLKIYSEPGFLSYPHFQLPLILLYDISFFRKFISFSVFYPSFVHYTTSFVVEAANITGMFVE